jgi:lambda family phage portal protein
MNGNGQKTIGTWLGRLADRFRFTYDAVTDKKRRRPPVTRLRTEDAELTQVERGQLITSARDLYRNFSVAAWMIRKHLDYVSTFRFQSRTGIAELDDRIEGLMRWWMQAGNFDVARRHPLRRMVRLAEARAALDGDVFLMRLADGRVQAIEGDRVRTPNVVEGANAPAPASLVHGVELSPEGASIRFAVCKRMGEGRFQLERMVPVENLLQHAYYDRLDQVRGISPLAAAVNSCQDIYEGIDYALAKAKVAQLFALAFYREATEAPGIVEEEEAEEGAEGKSKYKIDFGRGPVMMDLEPGDRAEFLESHQPSSEFLAFNQAVVAISLKALDIPYSFFDPSVTNYSGARQELLQYQQSAEDKQQNIRDDLLDPLTTWRLGLWVVNDKLQLPAGARLEALRWEWIPAGIPWIDPLKEVQADVTAIGAALASRTRILKMQGADFFDVADELAAENQYLEALGLPTAVSPGNAQIVEIAGGGKGGK